MKREQGKGFSISQRSKSFKHAVEGVMYAFRTQHNLWIHFIAGIAVVLLGLALRVSITEWCFLIFAIGIVVISELFNTAFECLTDLLSPDFH
jgi:undecaprenol kinase